MKKSNKNTPQLTTETVPAVFSPTQKQIDALARRLIPEIRKLYADELIQREFIDWQEKRSADQ